jgi:hypothetical protein
MNTNRPFGDPVKVIGVVPAPIPVLGHFYSTRDTRPRPRLSVPSSGVRINLELLVADLALKIRRRELDWKSVNLDDDLRGAIRQHEVKETCWHTEKV